MRSYLSDWRRFKWHMIIFSVVAVVILWAIRDIGGTSWFLIIWTMLAIAHYLVVKALNVDDKWAESRAYELRNKTYDHHHIDQIIESAIDGDPDEDPAAPKRI